MQISDYQNEDDIVAALRGQRIAVVGLSSNPARASNDVAHYMLQQGYDIVPVNPRETSVFGLPCYPSLEDIPDPVQVVDVFRASDAVPDIAAQTVAIGAPFLWLQLGVISAEGVDIARAGNVRVIVDKCLKIEHARFRARLG